MADKLFIVDERMLQLLKYAVANEIVSSQKEFLDKIGVSSTNISKLRTGARGFTHEQVLVAATMTGANINWLYGLENNMLRESKKHSALELLKSVVILVESELKEKKPRI